MLSRSRVPHGEMDELIVLLLYMIRYYELHVEQAIQRPRMRQRIKKIYSSQQTNCAEAVLLLDALRFGNCRWHAFQLHFI